MGLPLIPAASPPTFSRAGPKARNRTRSPAGPAFLSTPSTRTPNSTTRVPRTTVRPVPVIPASRRPRGRTRGRRRGGSPPPRGGRSPPRERPAPRSPAGGRILHAGAGGASPSLLHRHGDLKPAQHHPGGLEGRPRGGFESRVRVAAGRHEHRLGDELHHHLGVLAGVLELVDGLVEGARADGGALQGHE